MDRTSTEEEPFIAREELAGNARSPKRGYIQTKLVVIGVLITAIASSMLTLLLTDILQALLVARFDSGRNGMQIWLPELQIPSLGNVPLIWTDEMSVFLNRTTKEGVAISDKAWDTLMPNGRGFISLAKLKENNTNYQIPELLIQLDNGASHTGKFAISAFHQIHCLSIVVKGYYQALGSEKHDVSHIDHCLEYLRHSIMCSADTALEPWKAEEGGVDGWGTTHMCRDYDELFKWAEAYRFTDSK
ncbi:hypothetical protein TWF694_001490 [Orbilia ellipsospora]|uniref:Uncharacterized protein n=1 Tax=Orbilia ellipsospora TaxID=2528407 RepID=A0AAV9XRY0_9PEZI